jgi:oligoribonuclease NrnB/cAMP/cGMP phosphodiesterase (DHH superfamily)
MLLRVLHHDHCFDGAASAAFFTRFVETAFYPGAEFRFTGMIHKANQTFEEELFDGDENAIVDFKYSSNRKLTWWFDHHQSAFLTPEDAKHFSLDRTGKKLYDPNYKSCTKFIASVARERFGFTAPDLDELVEWADIVDGAQYQDARTAVEMPAPAMKLTLVIEGAKGSDTVRKMIGWMREKPLAEIVEQPEVQALFVPLYEQHLQSVDMIRETSKQDDGVVTFDLARYHVEGYNKFIPYYLFPQSSYTVSVLRTDSRTKISVGSNPWSPKEITHNLASICEQYGGGGHPKVGAISMAPEALDQARKVAAEIVEILKT